MFNSAKFLKGFAPIVFIAQVSALILCADAFAESPEPPPDSADWAYMSSNFFDIYYHPGANLENMEKELEKRPLYFDQAARYGAVTYQEEICYRLDKLFNRVREALDMYPKAPRAKIMVYRDRAELNEEYFKLTGKREDARAFYIYKYNTIYTSENDMEDSVMIHEMAHAVMDHYFPVIMPERAREILASYVDAHLEK